MQDPDAGDRQRQIADRDRCSVDGKAFDVGAGGITLDYIPCRDGGGVDLKPRHGHAPAQKNEVSERRR
jgi:hypothetical protein